MRQCPRLLRARSCIGTEQRQTCDPLYFHTVASCLQVVAAAAQTLCALAKLSASARQQLSDLQQKYMAYLQDTSTKLLKPDATPTQLQSNVAFACRYVLPH